MATTGTGYADAIGSDFLNNLRVDSREPGARRKKLAGYLKAANELRQSYFSAENEEEPHRHNIDDDDCPFPHAAIVRSGGEELMLFPSYAREHVDNPTPIQTPGQELTDEEYWRRQWESDNRKNAVVNVDVRGWVYAPHRGPMTRKHRLMIGLARQLSGIPAPPATRPDGTYTPNANSGPDGTSQQEEDLIAFEAENIIRQGQREQNVASRGEFLDDHESRSGNGAVPKTVDVNDFASRDRKPQPSRSYEVEPRKPNPRASWSDPSSLTPLEIANANSHLLTRLKPFMANPKPETMVKAFFYNDQASREHITKTDASGHFKFQSALDFVPTHVRVLTGNNLKLTTTEKVVVTPRTGVSLISDIDDTIKHSAISAGAREIFRNAFVRDLDGLTVEGVREWYNTLADMGVGIHYVSNSPWQMYPILTTYFKMAHLPRGSFHLKQYTGMLQGIFEPVAERKRSSLDKILRDFPDRKFVLVGDSGEADLEVYTEVALDSPGRILAIYIRDVTSTTKSGYFDANYSPTFAGMVKSRGHTRQKSWDSLSMSRKVTRPQDARDEDAHLKAAIAASLQDMESEPQRAWKDVSNDRPRLPPRPPKPIIGLATGAPITASPEHDLIDFTDPAPGSTHIQQPYSAQATGLHPPASKSTKSNLLPARPPKPAGLRSPSPNVPQSSATEGVSKQPPPRPRKPSTDVSRPALVPQAVGQTSSTRSDTAAQLPPAALLSKPRPPLPVRRSYRDMARETIAKALPTTSSRVNSPTTSPLAPAMHKNKSFEDLNLPESSIPPPPPPRRSRLSYPRQGSQLVSHSRSSSYDSQASSSPGEGLSKKEYLWKQRLARAHHILERNGVVLRTWKTGSDVADNCVKLVERELQSLKSHTGKVK